jgi:hypothetical protein
MHPLWIFGLCILEVETATQIRVWNFKFEMKTRNRNEQKKTKRKKENSPELTWVESPSWTGPLPKSLLGPFSLFFLFRASPLGRMPRLASLGGGTKRPAAACLTARWTRSGQIHLPPWTESRVPRRASIASLESALALITDHRDRWRSKQIRHALS